MNRRCSRQREAFLLLARVGLQRARVAVLSVAALSVAVDVLRGGTEQLEPREELRAFPFSSSLCPRRGAVLGLSKPRATASGPKPP